MFAYLDPGAGSALVAALTAGVAGMSVLFRMYRDRIMGVFSKKRRSRAADARKQLLGDAESGEGLDAQG